MTQIELKNKYDVINPFVIYSEIEGDNLSVETNRFLYTENNPDYDDEILTETDESLKPHDTYTDKYKVE